MAAGAERWWGKGDRLRPVFCLRRCAIKQDVDCVPSNLIIVGIGVRLVMHASLYRCRSTRELLDAA